MADCACVPVTPATHPIGLSGAVPAIGYHLVQWSDASTANPRTDSNVTGNISVTASFAINQYTLTYAAGANGSISGTSPQTVDHGAAGSAVTAVPDSGYHFVQWSDASTANPRTDANVTADLSLTATFANDAPTIAIVGNLSLLEDSGTSNVTITIDDLESPTASLVVTAASNTPALIPQPSVAVGGTAEERVISIAPLPQQNGGPAIIMLTITDPLGASSQRTFEVAVTAVNDQPTLSLGSVATHPAATTGPQSQIGFATVDFGPADEETSQAVDDYLIDSVNDPSGVLNVGSVDVDNNGTLSYQLTGVGGTATITARVRDNGGTDNGGTDNGGLNTSAAQQFTIGVVPGADLQVAKNN